MITNAEIKQVKALHEKKFRDECGLFIVEGEKMVAEALDSDFKVVKVYRREEVGEAAMSRMSQLSTPSPVLAVVEKARPAEFGIGSSCLCLALDSVRDPGNMGTIIRLADWFGVDAIFASRDSVELYNPKVIQSSMGSIFRLRVEYRELTEVCRNFRKAGLPVYGTFLDGEDIYAGSLSANGLIVMGNESNGISRETAAEISSRITIPRHGNSRAESLNVATATAITLSEFRRRR